MIRRCYGCDHAASRYEANLDWDTTPVVLLCDACAIWERAAGSVIWIRSRRPEAKLLADGAGWGGGT